MARSPSHESDQVVVDWRMVYLGLGIVGAAVVGLAIALICLALHPRSEAEPIVVMEKEPVKVRLLPPDPTPPPVAEAAAPLEWSPPPPPPPELPRPVVARKPVAAPQPVAIAEQAVAPEKKRSRFREQYTAMQLEAELRTHAEEVALDPSKSLKERREQFTKLLKSAKDSSDSAWLDSFAKNKNLDGLPMVGADKCKTEDKKARYMRSYSVELRRYLFALTRTSESLSQSPHGRPADVVARMLKRYEKPEAVATLVQVLQAQDEPFRLALVKTLANTKGPEASQALARRAIFDLSPEVRKEAIHLLNGRPGAHPLEEFEGELLAGLRYPWAPVADHAAEALVTLYARGAVPSLVRLLDQPDPSEPFKNSEGKWVKRELVAVNHLSNCLLCHAGAKDAKSASVPGLIPVPGEPIRQAYYESRSGDFVKAEVVYLWQDFSVTQPIARRPSLSEPDDSNDSKDPWPAFQRFDYLVRTRELTKEEVNAWKDRKPARQYPQREAVLFALRELTGLEGGAEASDWEATLLEHGYELKTK
jgi:hypothetical protein